MVKLKKLSLLYFFVASTMLTFSQTNSNFKKITPQINGANIFVKKTLEGPFGTTWMLVRAGILVFDGYDYSLIENSQIFADSDYKGGIKDIQKDFTGQIWILSEDGMLIKYDESKGNFKNISKTLNYKIVNKIAVSKTGLWYVDGLGGLFKYNEERVVDSITKINKDFLKKAIQHMVVVDDTHIFYSTFGGKVFNLSLESGKITEIIGPFTEFPGNLILQTDNLGKLWIGTETYGLFVYDITKEKFIQDTFFTDDSFNIESELFMTLFLDSNGFIWGGTDGGGLYKIDAKQGAITLFTKDISNKFSLGSNTILNISEDSHNNIWVTTNYQEINVLPSTNPSIHYHSGSANNVPQRVLSILKSSSGTLWLGTDGAGITQIRSTLNEKVKEKQHFNNVFRKKGFYVQSITEDNKQNIWFGTYKNGLWYYNVTKDSFKKIDLKNSKNHHATDVRTVFKDSKGRIWVGSNISLAVYSQDLELLAEFEYGEKGLYGRIVESIFEDEKNRLWFGSPLKGIYEFIENKVNFMDSHFYNHIPNVENILRARFSPKSMTTGKDHSIWFINGLGQLVNYNIKPKEFKFFDVQETLRNQSYLSVVSENENSLWMSSNKGISNYIIDKDSLVTYYNSDGFDGNSYLGRSVYKDESGMIYFGGMRGVNYFNPDYIVKKKVDPKLIFNKIEVLNRPLEAILPQKVYTNVNYINELTLEYDQASFSFEFAAIDNVLNHDYNYAYMLKGFDEEWISSHSNRVATYTNIPPGTYDFIVKGGTANGVWDITPKQIQVKINPPFWSSVRAYVVYLVFFVLFVFLIRRWYLFRRNMLLEKVHFLKGHELHDLKMDFFAKMSHEIQTPITLILGPIDDMMQRAEKNGNLLLKQRLKIIANNAIRLSKIARDLTLVRDKELNKLQLAVTKNNVYNNVEDIALSFRELARKKQIDFVVNCPKNLTEAWYDRDKIEHVIYNLLSNAFKFTPKDGNIQFGVIPYTDKKKIKIYITDSGPGISENELKTIFKLFYQAKEGKKQKGSGIGLALTKELIDLHNGSVEVTSSPDEGTRFVVILPISEMDYLDEDKISSSSNSDIEELVIVPEIKSNVMKVHESDVNKQSILIVEDNLDLQEFLRDLLIPDYNILLAENGEEGYHYAKNNYPDLIISDIMMPVLDGVTMCKMLQKDSLTKHIPVILLTAKNSINSKISGLKSGAIEYINKPFNTNELLLKIKNIIASKEHIISKYRAETISNPEITIQKSKDEVFLESLMVVVNSKLTEPDLKMEELADAMNMSYSSFYRKCQALTGSSIIDFVRLIRLKKAAVILAKYGYSISEVAFMVGFNDPKYFSKCFKKQFGKTPKLFAIEAKNVGAEDFLKQFNLYDI